MTAAAASSQNRMPPADADDIARQAAEWLVRLSSDDATDADRAGFEDWKRVDPRHARSAARLEGLIGRTQSLRANSAADPGAGSAAHAALDAAFASEDETRRKRRRRRAGTALSMALASLVCLWALVQHYPLSRLTADLSTAAAEWETHTLSDATRLTLSSASAVNMRFDADRRAVELVQGEILVDVAADPARPFLVETDQGSIRALGTRFVVRREGEATVLTMLESRAMVRSVRPARLDRSEMVIDAGQRVRIFATGFGPVEEIDAGFISDAWERRQLVVEDRPLPEVLNELARHRPGYIRYDHAQLTRFRVTAVLPLDDTDRALHLLSTSFPLRVRTYTPWVVVVDATTMY